MAEELTLGGAGAEFAAGAELRRARFQAQRAPEPSRPPPQALLAEQEAVEQQEAEFEARRALQRSRRASRTGGADATAADVASGITSVTEELIEVITFIVEIETIVVPLALLAKWNLQIFSGNMGIMPEFFAPAVKALDKLVELASAGAKTATKAGTSATTSAVSQAGSSAGRAAGGAKAGTKAGGGESATQQLLGGGEEGGVKKLSIPMVLLVALSDLLLGMLLVVNFIVLAFVPLLLLGVAGGIFAGVCSALGDLCTTETFSSVLEVFSSLF